jgi:transcriptional regulator with XRE-family HTH domain
VKGDLKKAFGATIRQLRLKEKLSQQELADYSEVDRSFLSELENGKGYPSLHIVYKLAEVLGVSPHKLIELVDKKLEKN